MRSLVQGFFDFHKMLSAMWRCDCTGGSQDWATGSGGSENLGLELRLGSCTPSQISRELAKPAKAPQPADEGKRSILE